VRLKKISDRDTLLVGFLMVKKTSKK